MDFYYVWLALFAGIFTWLITLIGSLVVFAFKRITSNVMSFFLGFGAGVMIAASMFSLIVPALDLATVMNQIDYIVVGLGVLTGGVTIYIIDLLIPKLSKNEERKNNSSFSRIILLVLAITIHNIPEGLAVGVAFGALSQSISGYTLASAFILALGIGLQNFPEGLAISLPLKTEGVSSKKSFFIGQLSAAVEPIAAVIGALLVTFVRGILPFILSFAAGAMIYVVAEELIPTGKTSKENKFSTIGVLIGFVIMMILDIALG